jgi:hypothetical protein
VRHGTIDAEWRPYLVPVVFVFDRNVFFIVEFRKSVYVSWWNLRAVRSNT